MQTPEQFKIYQTTDIYKIQPSYKRINAQFIQKWVIIQIFEALNILLNFVFISMERLSKYNVITLLHSKCLW